MIPTFDKFMFPILDWLKDGLVRTNKEVQQKMQEIFHPSEEEIKDKTSKGNVRFYSNVNWALTFLYQAGLTEKPKQGRHVISQTGKDYLAEGITEIKEKDLVKRFGAHSPRFFFSRSSVKMSDEGDTEALSSITPEELIHESVNKLEEAIITELLDKVRKVDPKDFERLVIDLLVKMGYGGSVEDAASVTSYTGDEGIDGVIKEDVLGLDTIYLQAKRYTTGSVGRPELQAFVGALSPKHAKKGVFITTSTFSSQAQQYAKEAEARIILIDGYQLCKYMLQFGLGVTTKEIIEIKSIDSDYFEFE